MSEHRYPTATLAGDSVRGTAGLAMTALPLALLDMHWVLATAFGAAAVLFAVFLVRTAGRRLTVIDVTEAGIAAHGPFGTAIAWPQLSDMRLRYYSTRRDREHGWMQLTLRGRRRALRLESTLDGFEEVCAQACAAARANGVAFNDATVENLLALGVDPGRGAPRTRWDLSGLDGARRDGEDGGRGPDGHPREGVAPREGAAR
jgi:hypothetical protein